MDKDTDIGGPGQTFPLTRRSVVAAVGSDDPGVRKQALDVVISAYWKPIYKYLRIKWSASTEEAKDLTQEFFARALEKGYLERYDPEKALFRTYLRMCLDGFVSKERKAAGRLKRGGTLARLPLDFESADSELHRLEIPDRADLDELFHQEWVRSVFSIAVEELRVQCAAAGKSLHFAVFSRHDLEGPNSESRASYADLGSEFGISTSDVTNYLAFARRRFRELVLEKLRELTGSDDEFQAECRRLLGVEPR